MPMPLMGKKPPTIHEVYKARKQREEEERNALLPPGLINHGNTCFMNSVLQGLIATPMLFDLVRFSLPESYLPIASQRSPQLTNGHGNAPKEYERKWEKGMRIGDILVMLLDSAWKAQEEKQRINLSPKEIHNRLGEKYDQYLDFRQQDAHELLRQLLDAVRMEEFDVIKKRQPRPPKAKRKKAFSSSNLEASISSLNDNEPAATQAVSEDIPEAQRLTSFVDMAFGGQLASVLVCDKCKKVSMTFEGFDDLSLPIKPEEYERVRRRDRLKTFAKKLRIVSLDDPPRSSSTPASPTRKAVDPEKIFERTSISDERRRSLDAESVVSTLEGGSSEPPATGQGGEIAEGSDANTSSSTRTPSETLDAAKSAVEGKAKQKGSGRDDQEGWGKLSRHLSKRLGRNRRTKDSQKGKYKDSAVPSSANSSSASSIRSSSRVASSDVISSLKPSESSTLLAVKSDSSPIITPSSVPNSSIPALAFPRPLISRAHSASPSLSTPDPDRQHVPILTPPQNQSITDRRSASPLSRPKSPQPPSLSKQETEYLRRLLTDVPSYAALPFSNLFRSSAMDSGGAGVGPSWPKFGGVQSVEDCLRMFTAVEILDGENSYGCRRCWKMANGKYVERGRAVSKHFADDDGDADSSSDDEDDEASSVPDSGKVVSQPERSLSPLSSSVDLGASAASESAGMHLKTPEDEPATVTTPTQSTVESVTQVKPNVQPDSSTTPSVIIPVISMTEPEPDPETPSTASSSDNDAPNHPYGNTLTKSLSPSHSRDSLRLPEQSSLGRHHIAPAISQGYSGDSSIISSEESDLDLESDLELSTSVQSDTSSMDSHDDKTHEGPVDNKVVQEEVQPTVTIVPPLSNDEPKSQTRKASRPKEVIRRRAFKRYLIAKPPPILVVHLKRFQQVGKQTMHAQFFSNLKKLDDDVAFPEYLDLTPFLLPKKEEFGLTKGTKEQGLKTPVKVEKCMYRLYAVVVHIGNMLGGHYIAYTALPDSSLIPNKPRSQPLDENVASSEPPESQSSLAPPARPPISRTSSFESSADPRAKPSQSASSRKWCYISDTVVKLTTLDEVLKSKAYICMYERI